MLSTRYANSFQPPSRLTTISPIDSLLDANALTSRVASAIAT